MRSCWESNLDYGNKNPGCWSLHYKAVINAKGMRVTRSGANKVGLEERPLVCGAPYAENACWKG